MPRGTGWRSDEGAATRGWQDGKRSESCGEFTTIHAQLRQQESEDPNFKQNTSTSDGRQTLGRLFVFPSKVLTDVHCDTPTLAKTGNIHQVRT